MGRSKFPGKPSKHVNRKRINVLPPTSEGIVESCNPVTVETVTDNKQPQNENDKNAPATPLDNSIMHAKANLRRRLTRKMQTAKTSSKRGLISKLCPKTGVNLSKLNKNRIKNGNNLVGKFVLPTRSVHSSRVIKPNKRFINMDLSDTITLKKRVKNVTKPQKCEHVEVSPEKIINGKVVLRQARLQLHSQPAKGEGPFSSSIGASSGTVTCGVCGAVRFYRFVKQARKFNIYSCESCRKFISKMIKRVSCRKNVKSATLACHKGQGMCHVPPIVRSQQMKLIRCGYRSRCPACWLKMCLRSFQMPLNLQNSLSQLLPNNMQGGDVIFNNSLPLLWQVNTNTKKPVNQRPVRVAATKLPPPQLTPNDVKRQKIDLKGPRVKHVCRSASIVLGQPVATFPGKEKDIDKKIKATNTTLASTEEIKHVKGLQELEIDLFEDKSQNKVPLIFNENIITQFKKYRNQKVPFTQAPSPVFAPITTLTLSNSKMEKKPMPDLPNMISLDFWDNFDLNDVKQSGFCLISSQQFPMPAICFLCGSAGREALLHCSLCCEPYHPYCLEQNPLISNINNKESLWFCPRCTICTACNSIDKHKYNCTKCFKPYHSECFNTEWTQKVCSKCLTCNDCGHTSFSNFLGSLPLCVACFKLKRKKICCSLCKNSSDETNDKFVECTSCDKWLHIICAGVSDEQYHILCVLPSSVKYTCSDCSKTISSTWRKSVEFELKSNLNQTLRLLSKNKLAKNLKLRKILCESDADDNKPSDYSETQTILDIKRKLNSNKYNSVSVFNYEIEETLKLYQSEELTNLYRSIFKSVFPWFTQTSLSSIKISNSNESIISTEEEVNDQIECFSIDSRYCSFCKSIGDGLSHLESRLLYCGQNEWVHINCALWSSEVYEEIDGSLQNVHSALQRGRLSRCSYCKQKGATVGCCFKGCCEIFHFICARTAKCHFMHDKTVFCSTHDLPKHCKIIVTPTDFNIRRSVFVEVADYKKGQYSQIDKVNVMVGSLCVTNLGRISPIISDNVEALIPTGYICSRLFWSTVEPWRLVSYKISTSVLNANINNLHVDKSFTVDHSLPKSVVERKLKEILLWYKDMDKKKTDIIDFEDDDEPQNGADLLSPEITDAIFEELPHELLDGISVQDIFPKLMSYEDLVNIDCKNDNSDNSNSEGKKCEEIDNFSPDGGKHRNQQRSCSLTLSCKLDNTFSPVMKKRKITPRENNLYFQLLQVDGNFDDSSSECSSPTDIRSSNYWNTSLSEEPVTCERCQCTYRTQASYKRHLDSCEMICSSESDSELNQDHDGTTSLNIEAKTLPVNITNNSNLITNEIPQPLALTAFESYQNEIHTSVLNTQTFVTSKTSEFISVPQNSVIQPEISCNLPTINTESINNEAYTTVRHSTLSVNEPVISSNQQFCLNPGVSLCVNPPLLQPTASVINTNLNQTITGIEFQPGPVTLQPLPYSTNVPLINVSQQNSNIINGVFTQGFNVTPQTNRWLNKVEARSPKKIVRRTIAAKRSLIEENEIMSQGLIVQHLPSTNFVPTFVDNFQQSSNQNVQYVTTFTPQITNPQPLVHFQADNNLISLVPGIQPTMIIQQPRVLDQQFIVDGNGSLSWSPQVQPMYYGFETIVQNTVMQSQQFLPSAVPGVLTANSSYSTTTQVFQTSKLEPVLDMSANSYVLVNPVVEVSAPTPAPAPAPARSSTPAPTPSTNRSIIQSTEVCKFTPYQKSNSTQIAGGNSINLPTAPFVPEQGIPTNIVTPTPKTLTQSRPMSRVLPMQTVKDIKIKQIQEKIEPVRKEIKIISNIVESIELDKKPPKSNTFSKTPVESPPTYKNNFNNRTSSVQIAPLKPIKSNPPKPIQILSMSDKQNRVQEKPDKKLPLEVPKSYVPEIKKEVENNAPSILYTIETQDGFKYSSTSIADLWTKVFEAVQNARAAHNMPLLPSDSGNIMNSLQIMGLKTSGLKYLIEQLPGATKCVKYKPSFTFPSKLIELDDDLLGHTNGSARCAPHCKRNEPYDMFGWLASIHRKPEHSLFCSDLVPRRGSVNNLPMAMRFRQLKLTSKYSVGVYRSKIHRRGLFCLRDFEAGEMVIEYSGEVIRSVLTDKREKFYNSKGIGCYMFRIDDNLVVDATMTGNAARFINHSCDPNCYSKVVEILGHKHIIIFALRRIICGEELTYDYKFPIEEDKIPCTCGARRCRKFLN